jgi:hypothetical protein
LNHPEFHATHSRDARGLIVDSEAAKAEVSSFLIVHAAQQNRQATERQPPISAWSDLSELVPRGMDGIASR